MLHRKRRYGRNGLIFTTADLAAFEMLRHARRPKASDSGFILYRRAAKPMEFTRYETKITKTFDIKIQKYGLHSYVSIIFPWRQRLYQ